MDEKETILSIRVMPGAKRNSIQSCQEGVWHIKIAASPVEGRANDEMMAYLSGLLGVRKSSLRVIKGHTKRSKLLSVTGLSGAEVSRRLSAQLD